MEPLYEITTTPRHTAPVHRPVPLTHPPVPANELPPGVQLVTLPGGTRTLAYTEPAAAPTPEAPAAAPVPRWARTTALLTPTVGGGTAAAGIGLSYAAPGLIAVTEALWAAVALIATSVPAVVALLWASRRHTTTPTTPTHITQHITATGLFGRANGTLNQH